MGLFQRQISALISISSISLFLIYGCIKASSVDRESLVVFVQVWKFLSSSHQNILASCVFKKEN